MREFDRGSGCRREGVRLVSVSLLFLFLFSSLASGTGKRASQSVYFGYEEKRPGQFRASSDKSKEGNGTAQRPRQGTPFPRNTDKSRKRREKQDKDQIDIIPDRRRRSVSTS